MILVLTVGVLISGTYALVVGFLMILVLGLVELSDFALKFSLYCFGFVAAFDFGCGCLLDWLILEILWLKIYCICYCCNWDS